MYVVEALRYGDREKHSYVVAVTSDLIKAWTFAVFEEYYRGGKYTCVVNEIELNVNKKFSNEFIDKIGNDTFNIEVNAKINEHVNKIVNGDI